MSFCAVLSESRLHTRPKGLAEIIINGNNITVVGARAIAHGIHANDTLAAIEVHQNDLRDAGGLALEAAILENKGTFHFFLSGKDATHACFILVSSIESLLRLSPAWQMTTCLCIRICCMQSRQHQHVEYNQNKDRVAFGRKSSFMQTTSE